uniref:Cellulase n=1 Tax=Steinernema glaseri TaxID=37863 RepID=A0A1I7Y4S4_9BILA
MWMCLRRSREEDYKAKSICFFLFKVNCFSLNYQIEALCSSAAVVNDLFLKTGDASGDAFGCSSGMTAVRR